MKLYATTTSERATKGQGGNDYINIIIKDENENVIKTLFICPDQQGHIIIDDGYGVLIKKQGGGHEITYKESLWIKSEVIRQSQINKKGKQ